MRRTLIAPALALAAVTAPAAQADPQPLARAEAAIAKASTHTPTNSGPCSEVCSAGGYGSLNQRAWTPDESGVTLPHDSRPRSLALPSGNNGSVNATVRTAASPVACGDVCSGHGYAPVGVPATVVRIVAPSGGFDWGDAAAGAGATIILMLIATGGVLAITNRRGRAQHQQASAGS